MKISLQIPIVIVAAPLLLTSCVLEIEEGVPYSGSYPARSYQPAPYQSGYYGGGYAPPAPYQAEYTIEERRRHAYELGRRLGRDDYHAGRKKSYGRHDSYYDYSTEQAFKDGFYSGYEEARERDKRERKKSKHR